MHIAIILGVTSSLPLLLTHTQGAGGGGGIKKKLFITQLTKTGEREKKLFENPHSDSSNSVIITELWEGKVTRLRHSDAKETYNLRTVVRGSASTPTQAYALTVI